MKATLPQHLAILLVVAVLCAAPAVGQQVYNGLDGQIALMVYHTNDPVTGNWTCTSASSPLEFNSTPGIQADECYTALPASWNNFGGLCTSGAVNSSLELQSLTGDKPGRRGSWIYHMVQSTNFSTSFGAVPDTGPGQIVGDNFVLFRCPLSDPNCKTTAPVLIDAVLRPDNDPCSNPDNEPTCDRYNWQLKATNEFAPSYDKLEVWAKLQNDGPKFPHTDVTDTGQLPGTSEYFFKDAVVVMNRTNADPPFSGTFDPPECALGEKCWEGPSNPRPAGKGWENALVWYMDNRWCDGSFGYSVPGGCPSSQPLEARLTDFNVERRVFTAQLPNLSGEPDSGRCTIGVDCNLASTTADGVGFVNFHVDTDRDVLAQNGGLCVDTVKGGVTPCANPTIPAACADRSNTSAACKPVTGCNCCEPTNTNQCKNPYLEEHSAYVIVDARKALFFPEYNTAGTSIVGWTWVKWGKVLTEVPPLHPGIRFRVVEVNVATTAAGTEEWQFWQVRGAGAMATNPLPVPTCDQAVDSTTVPTPVPTPFTTHNQIGTLSSQKQDAWSCNQGATDYATLSSRGRVLKYGTFDPNTGVVTTTSAAKDSAMRIPGYTNPHMPTWYSRGITWLAGFLEVKDGAGDVTYRSISWGGQPQFTCNVANTTPYRIPGRAILYEQLGFTGE